MRKLYFLASLLFLTVLHVAGQTVLSESFENEGLPTGWIILDADGDNQNWIWRSNINNPVRTHSGDGCMISASYWYDPGTQYGSALTPDNWLITPEVTLPDGAVLSFYVVAQDISWLEEHYGVYISTNGGTLPEDFVSLYQADSVPSEYELVTVDLSAYAGQDVRVAFRHYNSFNQYWMNIDDVTIAAGSLSSTDCPLQVHLERILGESSDDYTIYYVVNNDWYNHQELVLDASTASLDTTFILPPSTPFEVQGSGNSDFRCVITDAAGNVSESYYYPNYKTFDACSPSCELQLNYGCDESLSTISNPIWIEVYVDDYVAWNMYQSYWTAVGHTYGSSIPVTAGKSFRFVWTEPDEVNHSSFFTIWDYSTNEMIFQKNAGEVLPNGEFLVYTPTCGSCAVSDRCPLTIHLERDANNPSYPDDYVLTYSLGGGQVDLHLGPTESSKDTVLMLCPGVPFEISTKYEPGVEYGGPDFQASFENAYGNVTTSGYYPQYSTSDPCARTCEYELFFGAATTLSNVSSNWIEVYEDDATTPFITTGTTNYNGGTYYYPFSVEAGKQYRFVWHEPDQVNASTFFNLLNQDGEVLFGKSQYTSLSDGEFLVVVPTCQTTIVTTDSVTQIQPNSAEGNGTIRSDAIPNYDPNVGMDFGLCYGTSHDPTMSDQHIDSHIDMLYGTFSFSLGLWDLDESTTYYVRAYASYNGDVFYGEELEFTTTVSAICPVPSTPTLLSRTINSITVECTVDPGNTPVSAYEFSYKRVNETDWTTSGNITTTQYQLTQLQSNTKYNVRVRAVCDFGNSEWSPIDTFATEYEYMDRLYVAPNGYGNGSSWANAMGDLSDALDVAANIRQIYNTTLEIWVAEGLYYGNTTANTAFRMVEGVNVYGGFAGNEAPNYDLSLRDFDAHPTILDGGGVRRVLTQSSDFGVMTVWDGFILQNGREPGSASSLLESAGCALLKGRSYMKNCLFRNNNSLFPGGTVNVYVTDPDEDAIARLHNCIFTGNNGIFTGNNAMNAAPVVFEYQGTSGNNGTHDYNHPGKGRSEFINCKFVGNKVGSRGTIYGGRLFVNCEISGNTGSSCAGVFASSADFINCNIVGNKVPYMQTYTTVGLSRCSGSMVNCVIWNNTMAGEPANMYDCDQLTMQHCALEGGLPWATDAEVITLQSDNMGSGTGLYYPYFVSPSDGDYRLREGSSLINAGMAFADMPSYDVDGNTRVQGGTIDIGCYEFQGDSYCTRPVSVSVSGIGSTSATVSWENSNPEEPTYYELSYRQEGEAVWTDIPAIHTPYVMLTGLQPQTPYQVKVRTACTDNTFSDYTENLTFSTTCVNDGINAITIVAPDGSGRSDDNIPFNSRHYYSYTQSIYTADEIGSAGTIDTIYFNYLDKSYGTEETRNVNIYMGHTLKTAFDNKEDWFPVDRLTLVYSGPLSYNGIEGEGWVAAPLQTPFPYNGLNNIVLAVDDNTGSAVVSFYSYSYFRTYYKGENTSIADFSYSASAESDIDPTAPSTALELIENNPYVRFAGACAATTCGMANVSVTDITDATATLVFAPGNNATDFELEYRAVGDDHYTALTVVSSPYQLQNLQRNTEYEVRIRSNCGSEYSIWKSVLFKTTVKQHRHLYVSPTGTGDGSSWDMAANSLAWALEEALLIKANTNFTPDIWVAEGTYLGDNTLSSAFYMEEGVNVYGGFAGNEPEDYNLSQRDFASHPTILDGQQLQRVLEQREKFDVRTVWDGFTIQNGHVYEYGAGVLLRGGAMLCNCTITGNSNHREENNTIHYDYRGGGVYVAGSDSVLLRNCLFENNSAQYGGALYAGSRTEIRNCVIRHNTAQYDGGGVYGNVHILNCEITHNVAGDQGGGVYGCTIANCLIANNTARQGGGVYGGYSIHSSTIVNNEIVGEDDEGNVGAGVYLPYQSHLVLSNCILWGNRRNGYVESVVRGSQQTSSVCTHVASDDGVPGEGNIVLLSWQFANGTLDPQFVHPAVGVGAQDETPDVDWRLMPGSPCINRGNADVVGSFDLDGNVRVQQDTLDLGCYESAHNGFLIPEPGDIIYVVEGGVGTGWGDSWENATGSLQGALDLAALHHSQVWVAEGTYYDYDTTVKSTFVMREGVSVYGGFAGNEPPTFPLENRDLVHHVSILDGMSRQRVLWQSHNFAEADSVTWDGFTIQNGRTTGNGAGVFMRSHSTLKNCIVQNNVIVGYGYKYGSGICVHGFNSEILGKCRISHCKIIHNGEELGTADVSGGGLYADSVHIDHTEIAYNVAEDGGGVAVTGNVKLSNCLIHDNIAKSEGGGVIDQRGSNIVLVNCDIVKNELKSTSDGGAGLVSKCLYDAWNTNPTGNVYATNCIIWGNRFVYETHGTGTSQTYSGDAVQPSNISGLCKSTLSHCAVEGGYEGTENIMLADENDKYNSQELCVRFIAPDQGSFRLHPMSACVNLGDNGVVGDDIDFYGNPRIGDGVVDIGCAEAASCLPVTSMGLTLTCDTAILKWNHAYMENQWELTYGEVGTDPVSIMVSDTIYELTDLLQEHNYAASVRAVCSAQSLSDPSPEVSFQVPLCGPSCPPVSELTYDVDCDKVLLTWNHGGDEEQWQLTYAQNGSTDETVLVVSDTAYELTGLDQNTLYDVSVAAICDDNLVSVNATSISFIIPECTSCPSVYGLAADVTCDSVVLRWNISPGVHQWIISFGQQGEDHILDTLDENKYVVTGLPMDTYYTASVSAVCGTLVGTSTPLLTFKTQCLQPVTLRPDLHVSAVSHSNPVASQTMTVTWTVTNDGDADVPIGQFWKDHIWLVRDADVRMFDPNDIELASVSNLQTLSVGESYTNTATVTIPDGLVGNYYLFVIAGQSDAYNIDFTPTGGIAPNPYTPSVSGNPYPYLTAQAHQQIHDYLEVVVDEVNNLDNFFYVVLNILPPPSPDLVVTEISHPLDVFSGQQIPVTWEVLNQGDVLADGFWRDNVFISQSTTLDMESSQLLGSIEHSVPLLKDSVYQQTAQVTIPITYSGDYYIFVFTDQGGELYESLGESNNISISSNPIHVTMTPTPDLVITNIDMPAAVSSGESYECRITITNNGYGPTNESSWYDDIYLSQYPELYPTHTLTLKSLNHYGVLNAGESYMITQTIKIPDNITGEWYLFVKTNSRNDVFENGAESNNLSMYTLYVNSPDLTVASVVTDNSSWSGNTISVSYTVKNVGAGAASYVANNFTDRIYLGASPDSYDLEDVVLLRTHNLNYGLHLDVNEEITYTLDVVLPNGWNGPGYIFVKCNDGEYLNELGQLDNNVGVSGEIDINLTPWPDIVMTNLTGPSQTYLGSPFPVTYTLRNDGIADLNEAPVSQVITYSESPFVVPPFAKRTVIYDTLTLAVGEEVTRTVEASMSVDDLEGEYYLHAFVDGNNQVYEYTGEDNNHQVGSQYHALAYMLDLAAAELEGPSEVTWGDTVTYRMKVKNQSNFPTLDTLWNCFCLADHEITSYFNIHPELELARIRHADTIYDQEEFWVEFDLIVPLGAPSPSYLVGVVDVTKRNPDIDRPNNIVNKELVVRTIPLPDLAIEDVYLLDVVYSGQPARLVYKVKNVGNEPVVNGNWTDICDFSNSHVVHENFSLAPGETYIDTVTITVPQPISGNVYVYLTVNSGNTMYEYYRSNNKAVVPVQVYEQAPGDLIVTDVTSDASVVSGSVLHTAWNVQNVGTNPMQGHGLRTLVYISVDDQFDAGDRLLGSVTTSIDLPVGGSIPQTLDQRVGGLPLGQYYLIVKTDVYNAFNEDDDLNNSAVSAETFEITVRPLPFNTDVYDTLVNDEVSDFKLDVGENMRQTVRIHLSSEDSLLGAYNQIYVTHNQLGNNLNYTYSTVGQHTANPELYIPSTKPGYYGVNVYGYTPVSDTQYTVLRADILPFTLMSIDDNHGGNSGDVTVELTGSKFRPDMKVCLRKGSDTIWADTLIYENYYQAFVRFNLSGKEVGVYDVIAQNFCEGEAELPESFTIEGPSPNDLGYNLIFPSAPRPNRNVVMMLEFGNTGNVDLHDQVLEITSIGGAPIGLTPEDLQLDKKVLQIPLSIEGEPEGLLRPGLHGTLNIYTFTSSPLVFSIKPVNPVHE